MTDKDPKDMTASELLRKADSHPCSMCHLVMAGEESCATTVCESWAYRLADKIDAELSQAREKGRRIVVCDHCSEESKPIIKTDDLTVYVDAFLGKLYVNHYNGQMWECETADINYCPMCGRDLRGGADHD